MGDYTVAGMLPTAGTTFFSPGFSVNTTGKVTASAITVNNSVGAALGTISATGSITGGSLISLGAITGASVSCTGGITSVKGNIAATTGTVSGLKGSFAALTLGYTDVHKTAIKTSYVYSSEFGGYVMVATAPITDSKVLTTLI